MLACELYEYGRESRAAIKEITAERKRMKQRKGKGGHTKFGPRVQTTFQGQILIYLMITDGFPNVPWTSLLDTDRAKFLKLVTSLFLCLCQSRQKHRRQNCDCGNHHKQFDQSKSAPNFHAAETFAENTFTRFRPLAIL
jgi:hypothetical protein